MLFDLFLKQFIQSISMNLYNFLKSFFTNIVRIDDTNKVPKDWNYNPWSRTGESINSFFYKNFLKKINIQPQTKKCCRTFKKAATR